MDRWTWSRRGLTLLVALIGALPAAAYAAPCPGADPCPYFDVVTFGKPDSAAVRGPGGMARDGAGGLWVADGGNHRVVRLNAAGQVLQTIGSQGSGAGQLNNPSDVALDGSGNVWVVDRSNHRVQKFSSAGAHLMTVGSSGSGVGQLSFPDSIALFGTSLYVSDTSNNRIQVFDQATGAQVDTFGSLGSGDGQFNVPFGIAIDAAGDVYVADIGHGKVQRFNSAGDFELNITGAGHFIGGPFDVAVDGGELYANDDRGNDIQVFNAGTGAFVREWGGEGASDGQLFSPRGLAVGGGEVWANDFTSRIQRFTTAGAHQATIARPVGLFFFTSAISSLAVGGGALFTGESGWARVQKLSLAGAPQAFSPLPPPLFVTDVSVDAPGDVYVGGLGRAQRFSASGAQELAFGASGTGSGQFTEARGIAANSVGDIYLVDGVRHRVSRFLANGQHSLTWGRDVNPAGGSGFETCTTSCQAGQTGTADGEMNDGMDVAIDSADNLWVVDRDNHRIQKFDPNGVFLAKLGRVDGSDLPIPGAGPGQFNLPQDIAFDAQGNFYVADAGNSRIQKFSPTMQFLGAWGSGGTGEGEFTGLTGVAVDAQGDVYAADTTHRVQKFVFTAPVEPPPPGGGAPDPPPGGGGPGPGGGATVGGKAAIAGKAKLTRSGRTFVLDTGIDVTGPATASATLATSGNAVASATLGRKKLSVAAGGKQRLKLKLSKKGAKLLKRSKKKVKTRLTVKVTTPAGTAPTVRRKLSL